uniref:Fatty acyl-CoA reductase n=1 Tax=Ericerus pela TaxID=931557 RepID=M9YZI8_ERIPE|nr:fatty acyl-CoA reductase [Ericerus pela]
MEEKSEISEFYSEKTIFVTGVSGFIGKVLVWKLLRSCPKLERIYVLMRAKRGKSTQHRLDELLQTPIFNNFKQNNPKTLLKISAINGDIALPNLGISPDDEQKLFSEVHVVFHIAAILKLDANLKDAVNMNVTGTLTLLQLAKRMLKLESFIHTSTAYCHCDIPVMEEKIYPARQNPYDIIELVRWMDPETLDLMTESLLKPHPNSYTYSKRLAENIVGSFYPDLPVVIARPSIVVPAWFEPIPGWVDNLNGPTGLLIGAGKGVIRTMHCNGNLKADLIPVDIVCNGMIAIPWKQSLNSTKPLNMPVFNLTQHELEPLNWSEVVELGKEASSKYPFEMVLWYPGGNVYANFYVHFILSLLFHWIPAYLIDFMLFLIGRKPFLVHVQKKIYHGQKVLSYFTTRSWLFDVNNLDDLKNSLSPVDRKIFPVTLKGLQKLPYMLQSLETVRHVFLKEDPSTIPWCKTRLKILYVVDRLVKILFFFFLTWMLLRILGLSSLRRKPFQETVGTPFS